MIGINGGHFFSSTCNFENFLQIHSMYQQQISRVYILREKSDRKRHVHLLRRNVFKPWLSFSFCVAILVWHHYLHALYDIQEQYMRIGFPTIVLSNLPQRWARIHEGMLRPRLTRKTNSFRHAGKTIARWRWY